MKRIISLLLSTMIVLSVFLFSGKSAMAAEQNDVSSFVTRMYSVCLDREPDPAGLNDWTSKLVNHEATGVSAAYGFIFSGEFQNKQCTNEQYVTYMYSAFFGRTPDPDGLNTWVTLLNNGASREFVFCGFANSVEFDNLCKSYGIIRGFHIEGQNFVQVGMVNLFVERLYNEVLGRSCDSQGMADWTTLLVNRTYSGSQVAAGFVFSEEFTNKHLCNSCYLDTLYQAFMGRSADSAGKSTWMELLNNGMSREDVFNGFAGSAEFNRICESYGISNGTMTFTGAGTYASGSCTKCGVVNPVITPSATTSPTTTPTPNSNSGSNSVSSSGANTTTPTPESSKPQYDEKGHAIYPGVPDGGAVDPNKTGFSREYCAYHDDYHIYYFDKGLVDPNFNGYKTIDGNTYFIKYHTPHAYPYCVSDSFLWVTGTNDRHYMDENGIMLKDTIIRFNDVWYKIDADGFVIDYVGWQTIEGQKYHYSDNPYSSYYSSRTIMDRGIEKIDGKIYYFAKTGELQEITGWKKIDEKWYYFEADHTVKTGWKQVNDKWYYFGDNGAWKEYNGWQLINDKYYYFKDGVWVKKTSWQSINNKWYFFDSEGNMKTGWIQDPDRDNNWYYLGDDGVMRTGILDLDDDRYILRENGQLVVSDWYKKDNYWYYSGANGKVSTGWTQIKGDWYYFGEERYNKGHMHTGSLEYSGAEYYLQENGVMLVGWNEYGSSYYDPNGKRIINDWYKIDGDWYYFGRYGYKYTDCFYEGYWIDKKGVAHDGWVDVRDNDSWIYIDPETHKMASGWKQIGEYWYYFDPDPYYHDAHLMVTGSQYITDSKGVRHEYYFDSQGRAQCGFVELYSLTYYFDPVTYAMVVDDYFYSNGKWYYAGPNGRIYSHFERTKDGYLTDMDGEVIDYPGK